MSSNDSTMNACMRDYLPILVKWHWDFVVVNLISIDFQLLWEKDTKNLLIENVCQAKLYCGFWFLAPIFFWEGWELDLIF